jgi:hypothetical protein
MLHKASAALLLLCLLSSCGGGGGGGSSSSGSSSSGGGNGVRFTPDRTSIDLAYDEGAFNMPAASVIVTASGTFNGTLYIAAIADGTGIDPNIQTQITGTQATFIMLARSGLAVGTYTGRISLLGCSDSACNRQIGNSPVNVNYTLTVRATLKATPESVTATTTSGNTTSQTIAIRMPFGANTFQTAIYSGSEFLSIDQETASGFRVNLRSLPPATFTGAIRVTSGNQQINIGVNYTVAAGVPYSTMTVSPQNLTLTGTEGAVSAPVLLNVTPPSWDPVTSVRFTTTPATPIWLRSAPTAGGHAITIDATDLTAGTYTGNVFVAGGWPQQELQVPVALTIGPGLQRPADVIKNIESETTVAALTGTTPVNVVAGPPTNWTARVDVPWLRLTDASGATGETLAYELDNPQLGALANGAEHVAHVTITPQRATMSPVSYDIHVVKRLAAVTSVGPYIQPASRPTRVLLRGFGFSGVTNLASRLQFTGGTVNSITLVNDTEIVVNTGALPVGFFPFSFTNALNYPVSSARLRTFTPTQQGAAVVPTGGYLRGLLYDAERESVYAINVELESLQRFRRGAQWQLSSVSVPAILSAGLTQDGSRVLVASSTPSTSRIRQLDAADMNIELASTDISQQLYRGFTYLTGVIPTTNDGRSWFAVGDTFNDLSYFDAATKVLTIVRPPIPTNFYSGPWFAISRDGERLVIPQGSSGAFPPGLYMDAVDSVLRVNPAGLGLTYRMSLSDDGDRFVYDSYEVRDRYFALVGRVGTLPRVTGEPQYYPIATQLSPDGARLYVASFPDSLPYLGYPARVFVLDSSTRQQTAADLPVLGYVNLSAYPWCNDWQTNPNCDRVAHTAISPDGNNLYIAGNVNFVVVPTGGALMPISKAAPPAVRKQGRTATTPWHLDIRH